jgi:tRNA pseudouridine13 synthase
MTITTAAELSPRGHGPKAKGSFRVEPADFVVDEIPLYSPSGTGEHLYLFIEKERRTTFDVIASLSGALDIRRDVIGTAGVKDKIGITRQWFSVAVPPRTPEFEARVLALTLDGIRILESKRHENKLRTGHLFGNRFTLRICDIDAGSKTSVEAILSKIAVEGLPNAYGEQRFGHGGRNVEKALRWVAEGMPRLRDLRDAKFLISALQSAVFNRTLELRVADGTWNTARVGDVMQRERAMPGEPEQRFAQFLCEDLAEVAPRVANFELSPTGPMPGVEMTATTLDVAELEAKACAEVVGPTFDWSRVRKFGEGTRRPLRLRVRDLAWQWLPARSGLAGATDATVTMALPKGAYATTVLGEAFELHNAGAPPADRAAAETSEVPADMDADTR